MKKNFTLIASCVMIMLCSCSKNEIHELKPTEASDNLMQFTTYTGSSTTTRAEDYVRDSIETQGFYAMARRTAGLYYDQTHFTFNTSGANKFYEPASGEDKWYWPQDQTDLIDFFAFNKNLKDANKINSTSFAPGNPKFSFTTANLGSKQKDILVAYTTNKKAIKNSHIALKFKHALSKITTEVRANTTDDRFKLYVTEISFVDINTTGDCTVGLNDNISSWSNQSNPITMPLEIKSDLKDGTWLNDLNNVGKFYSAASYKNAMMIVPQKLSKMKVKYYWTHGEGGEVEIDTTYKNTPIEISLDTLNLKANSHYNFKLNFDTDSLLPITFTADVDGWDTTPSDTIVFN